MVNYPLQVQLLISLHQHNHPTILTIFQGHLSHILSSHLSQRIPIFHQSHSKYFMWFAHKDVFHRSHSPANSLSAWRVLRRICKRGESHRVQTVNGQRTWVFIWFMYRATAKAKGSRQKKGLFQVDIFWLILPFYNGKNWTKFFTFASGSCKKNGLFTVRLTVRGGRGVTPRPWP